MVDQYNLGRAQQPLGNQQRSNDIICHHPTRIPDDMSLAKAEPKQPVDIQAGIHARDNRHLALRRHGQITLIEIIGICLIRPEKFISSTHRTAPSDLSENLNGINA